MPKLPTRIIGPILVTNANVVLFTNSAGTQTIVRHIHLQNNSASPITFTMSIGASAAGTRIYDAFPVAANAVLDAFCYYVLTGTQTLEALAGTTNVSTLTVDADVFTAG